MKDDFEGYIDEHTEFFVSIGNVDVRKRIQERITAAGGQIAKLIHPKAVIGKEVEIGVGCVVMAGVIINSGAKIGNGTIVNTSGSVDHDCVIGDFGHIAVGAYVCGSVNIGDRTWVGAGSVIKNYLSICGGCMIGAGAVVVKDIKEKRTYVGVPAIIVVD